MDTPEIRERLKKNVAEATDSHLQSLLTDQLYVLVKSTPLAKRDDLVLDYPGLVFFMVDLLDQEVARRAYDRAMRIV